MRAVGGTVTVFENGLLTLLDMSLVTAIGGNLTISYTNLVEIVLPELLTVDGSMLVFGNPFLKLVNIFQVGSINGSLDLFDSGEASSNPNLQNIPIKSEEGKEIRKAFIADKNNILISADYNQIEMRILADMADV